VLAWLDNANKSLDDAPSVFGDPKRIQGELLKLKVQLPFIYYCVKKMYSIGKEIIWLQFLVT